MNCAHWSLKNVFISVSKCYMPVKKTVRRTILCPVQESFIRILWELWRVDSKIKNVFQIKVYDFVTQRLYRCIQLDKPGKDKQSFLRLKYAAILIKETKLIVRLSVRNFDPPPLPRNITSHRNWTWYWTRNSNKSMFPLVL